MLRHTKHVITAGAIFLAGLTLSSCSSDPKNPGRVYMPDMMYSNAMETMVESDLFEDGKAIREPVAGTIPFGYLSMDTTKQSDENYLEAILFKTRFENTPEDYERAGAELKNPVSLENEVLAEGKALYQIYCYPCHGAKGEGNGPVVENGGFPPPPAYSLRLKEITEGHMFFSITYGRNLMGSHASQLNPEERWKVIHYIQDLAGVSNSDESTDSETGTDAEANAEGDVVMQ